MPLGLYAISVLIGNYNSDHVRIQYGDNSWSTALQLVHVTTWVYRAAVYYLISCLC